VDVDFQSGDLVVDTISGDFGLLLERFDVLEHAPEAKLRGKVYAWDIVWTGKSVTSLNKYTPYTEVGLNKCIKDGILLYVSSN
jgi:hypothetical protein